MKWCKECLFLWLKSLWICCCFWNWGCGRITDSNESIFYGVKKKKNPCTSLKVLMDFFRCSRTADVVILKYESTRFELVSQQKELETWLWYKLLGILFLLMQLCRLCCGWEPRAVWVTLPPWREDMGCHQQWTKPVFLMIALFSFSYLWGC